MLKRKLCFALVAGLVYMFQIFSYPLIAYAQTTPEKDPIKAGECVKDQNPAGCPDQTGLSTPYYKPGDDVCSGAPQVLKPGGLQSGSKIYILGDSITVREADTYKSTLKSKAGFETDISAVSGRSWSTPGDPSTGTTGTQGTGKQALESDANNENIPNNPKKANGIIIALGTNGYTGSNPIEEIIAAVRKINPSAPIWWVNVANGPPGNTSVVDFNNQLDAAAAKGEISVIAWNKVVDPTGDGTNNPLGILADGTHPDYGKLNLLGDLVANALTGGAGSTPTGVTTNNPGASSGKCQCSATSAASDTGDGLKTSFLYFVGAPLSLSAEQAAGIVGNIQAESGGNAQIEQGKTPETSRDIETFLATGNSKLTGAGAIGYGLVQWTGYGQLDKMAEWVKANKPELGPGSVLGQLSYIGYELQNEKKSIADEIRATPPAGTDPIDYAAARWNVLYERSKDSETPGSAGWQLRIKFAHEIYAKFKDLAGTKVSETGATGCAQTVGAGGGSESEAAKKVVQTGLALAWPTRQAEGKKFKEDATPAYQEAMEKYNGSTGYDEWSDCGVFVATVMIASGADVNYPKRFTPTQEPYARNHPEKYAIIENVTGTDQLLPGDILINAHHTMIFVGEQPGGFNTVDASQGDRVPGAKIWAPYTTPPTPWTALRIMN